MRKAVTITAFTVAHLLATVLAFLLSFGAGMGRMDSGEPATFGSKALEVVARVLMFPLVDPGARVLRLPGVAGYLVFLANSVLWACIVYFLLTRVRMRSAPARRAESA